jgi:hypothetical protein
MKQVHLNRGAHEKLVPGSLNFVELHDEGWIVWTGRGSRLLSGAEWSAVFLYIRIASGAGAWPDEVGWLFHRLS